MGSPLALARYGGTYGTTSTTSLNGRRKTTIEGQAVRLLGYERTLPLALDRGPLAYTLTGHYIIPRRTPDGTAASLPTSTYLNLQVDYSF